MPPKKRSTVNPPEVDVILDLIESEMDRQSITEYRLAKLTEMDPSGIGRILNREARPKLETALRMLEAVGKCDSCRVHRSVRWRSRRSSLASVPAILLAVAIVRPPARSSLLRATANPITEATMDTDTNPEIVIPLTWSECVALAHADAERLAEPDDGTIPPTPQIDG